MLLLIFLSTLAIASHQEFQLQLERPMHWPLYPSPSQNFQHPRNPFQHPDDPNLFGYYGPESRNNNNKWMKEMLGAYKFDAAQLRYYSNYFFKTATFTMTSTVNVTSVETCIPVGRFVNTLSVSVICTRKKRDIFKDSSGIDPSEPQQVTMTTVPVVGHLERGNRHLIYDRDLISSSKDDVIVSSDEMRKRQNRFLFHHWVTYTTVVSYSVNTFVITSTIFPARAGQLVCRFSEYPVCSG